MEKNEKRTRPWVSAGVVDSCAHMDKSTTLGVTSKRACVEKRTLVGRHSILLCWKSLSLASCHCGNALRKHCGILQNFEKHLAISSWTAVKFWLTWFTGAVIYVCITSFRCALCNPNVKEPWKQRTTLKYQVCMKYTARALYMLGAVHGADFPSRVICQCTNKCSFQLQCTLTVHSKVPYARAL